MKLAFFSPFPPKQTGVAAYSQTLVRALRHTMQVTAFDHGNPELTGVDREAIDFGATPESLASLGEWDLPIFSLGNNPYYHLEILRVSLRTRGLLLLHDTVLYYLFAGLPKGSFYRHFCETYGEDRAREIAALQATAPERNLLRYPYPSRYPFLSAAVRHSEGVIVHNRYAAASVKAAAPDVRVHLLPMISHVALRNENRFARSRELRKSVVKTSHQILFGTFGFIGPTKRLQSISAALARLPFSLQWHFAIVGDGPDPMPDFFAAGVGERVTWLRYVSDEDYDAWIEASDLVLNLRYPSMGESSATLSRAMGMGKACLVTRDASFEEIPDKAVMKVPFDESETEHVADAITRLSLDSKERDRLGTEAAHYTQSIHAPERVAARMREIVAETLETRRHPSVAVIKNANRTKRIADYLSTSVRNALPSHLREAANSKAPELPGSIQIGLSREQAIWCYRVLLDRDPHPEHELLTVMRNAASIDDLRGLIVESQEYREKQKAFRPAATVPEQP